MTIHRFRVPGVVAGEIVLLEDAFAHVTRVLRLEPGDVIRVFDEGREFDATLSRVERQRAWVAVGSPVEGLAERRVPIHLITSPLKGDLTELVIQQATQLGVARISLVLFDRTDTVARRDPGEARLQRFRRVATSASEQSGRTVVPVVESAATLREMTASLGPATNDVIRIVAAEPSIAIAETPRSEPTSMRAVVCAVGPAGGLTARDLAVLADAGFEAERFAAHTLRSETACAAAVAILAARYA